MKIQYTLISLLAVLSVDAVSTQAIVFAAGRSKRFGTFKLIAPINGKPIIYYPLQALNELNIPTTLVVGHKKEELKQTVTELFPETPFTYVTQIEQLGTGDALLVTKDTWNASSIVVVNGDAPLTSSSLIDKLITAHNSADATITILVTQAPHEYSWGRIVTEGGHTAIVEAADFDISKNEQCPFVNAGYYIFNTDFLLQHADKLQLHTNKNEYYITDLIAIASDLGYAVQSVEVPFNDVFSVNTQEEFIYAEQLLKARAANL